MAATAKIVPAMPMRREMSEKTIMGTGVRVGTEAELGFRGLRSLEEKVVVVVVGREEDWR